MMTKRNDKRTILRIGAAAAVLLFIAVLFVGAGAANQIELSWDSLQTDSWGGGGEYDYLINGSVTELTPKDEVTINGNVTITFASNVSYTVNNTADSGADYRGGLFNKVIFSNAASKLTIKNLYVNGGTVLGHDSVGGLVGYANSASGNLVFENCTVFDVMVSGSTAVGGLVGFANSASCHCTECVVANCTIAGSSNVGGLVGYAIYAGVNATNCHLHHCNVTSGKNYVGGLVGYAIYAGVNVSNCTVFNSTIASGNSRVGGLVGIVSYASTIGIEGCNVEHTSIYAWSFHVGGLIGSAEIASTISSSNVTNCVIASGSNNNVGGLIGCTNSMITINRCGVANCTVAGSSNVGGLVGSAKSASSDCSGNCVMNCAVNASKGVSATYVCGNDLPALKCNVMGENFIYNGSIYDTITPYGSSESPSSWGATSVTSVKAKKHEGASEVIVTSLGEYGKILGYGVGSAPTVTVNDEIKHGTVNVSMYGVTPKLKALTTLQGTKIAVAAEADSCYHLEKLTWKNKDSGAEQDITSEKFFILGNINAEVNATFAANVTTLILDANGSEGGTSAVEATYGSNTLNVTISNPEQAGKTFQGWNAGDTREVINKTGKLVMADTPYTNPSGYWIYEGAHKGTFTLYANWSVLESKAVVSDDVAEFGGDNYTMIKPSDVVTAVLLENVSGLSDGETVTFIAKNSSAVKDIPPSYGNYQKEGQTIAIFNISATTSGTAKINVTVMFADTEKATENINKVKFWHHGTNGWGEQPLTIAAKVQSGEKILYTVETKNFSPFGIGIYTPVSAPQQSSSSSSRNYGASIWLQETATPTAVPTAEPTAEPTPAVPAASPVQPTPQASTPAPFVGLLAGLGAAAVLVMRRK